MFMFRLRSIKTQLIIFLVCFGLYLSIKDRDLIFLFSTFVSVISAITTESVITYLKEKKLLISESSVISGLIIGYVLSSEQPWWIFLAASLLAIASKHLIRVNKNHLFNPAAFGIFISTLLFSATTQWKGIYIWYIILPAGLYFVYKIRKVEIIIGYAIAFLVLFGTQAVIQKVNLLNIFGYLSYFYIFVMVVEPKTTPRNPLGKFIFGIGACSLIFILIEIGVKFDVELSALLVFNSMVPLLNRLQILENKE